MTADSPVRLGRFLDDLRGPDGTPPGPANRVVAQRIDSTNRLARRIVATYLADEVRPPELAVFALEQTAGRGRRGRTWTSPPGAGVYVTRVLPLPEPETEEAERYSAALSSLPLLVGVGIARAVGGILSEAGSASRCGLEWPNDVLIDGRKVGGILAESLAIGSGPPVALLGFGVNHARPRIGPELPDGATAVSDHAGAPPSLGSLARALVAGVEAELAHLGDLAYAVPAYRELSVHREGERLRCRTGDETIEGEFAGFDERGHLRLLCDGETVLLAAGEIVEDRTHDE